MIYRISLVSAVYFSFIVMLSAQVDAHYWTHQYGAKGLLLNGAVISSSEGETSMYYNPGSMGMDDNLGFAFSFLTPSYSSLQTENFIGAGNILEDNGLDFSPGFLGFRFKPFKSEKFVAGVTAFKRFKTDIEFQDRVTDFVNNSTVLLFRGDLDFTRKVSEDWYGLGLSYKLSDRIGIGLTQFSVWHRQHFDANIKKEIFLTSIPTVPQISWRGEYGYNLNISSGMISKLGFSYRHEKFNLGLTFTSPLYLIPRKRASYFFEDSRSNITEEEFSSQSNRSDVELKNFYSAASIGAGFDFKAGRNHISFSAEYFSGVSDYVIFEDTEDTFDDLALVPEIVTTELRSRSDKVFNAAMGFMHHSSEKLTLLGGFRTDFDQNKSLRVNSSSEYLGTTGDVYHLSGGAMFEFGKNSISLGFDAGYGSKKEALQLVDLSMITQDNIYEISGQNNVNSRFYSIMLFVTYDFIFSSINSKEHNH